MKEKLNKGGKVMRTCPRFKFKLYLAGMKQSMLKSDVVNIVVFPFCHKVMFSQLL